MSKKEPKTKPDAKAKPDAAAADGAPIKRSKVKVALLVLAPLLVLGGAGYAGWMFYVGPKFFPAETHEAKAEGEHGEAPAAHGAEAGHGTDPMKVAALPLDVLAESSATHSYALSVLISERCGEMDLPALKAASDREALENGTLVNLSWAAAARRTTGLNDKNCNFFWSEIENAETKLTKVDVPTHAAPAH